MVLRVCSWLWAHSWQCLGTIRGTGYHTWLAACKASGLVLLYYHHPEMFSYIFLRENMHLGSGTGRPREEEGTRV